MCCACALTKKKHKLYATVFIQTFLKVEAGHYIWIKGILTLSLISFWNPFYSGKKVRPGILIIMNIIDNSYTGKSFSVAFILASTNQQYDKRLFIELRVQYMKTTSSVHVVYINCSECQNKNKKQFLYTICSRRVLSLQFSWTIFCHIVG